MNHQESLALPCLYDEWSSVGRDFGGREVVEAYDAYHRRFRDIEAETQAVIAGLGLAPSMTLADFGCGTGALGLQAARICTTVHAIDVSRAMLDYTEWKAKSQGQTNIVYHHAGFLTYVHEGPPLDAAAASMALHHLPDFWKQKALGRISRMLKPGGHLYLADVVFAEEEVETRIAQWIRDMTAKAGPDIGRDLVRHVSTEYSTFTWIMEGLLSRAGFRIDQADYHDGVLARYFCTKVV